MAAPWHGGATGRRSRAAGGEVRHAEPVWILPPDAPLPARRGARAPRTAPAPGTCRVPAACCAHGTAGGAGRQGGAPRRAPWPRTVPPYDSVPAACLGAAPRAVCAARAAVCFRFGQLGRLERFRAQGAPGAADRAAEYQKSPVFMPTDDGVQLVRGSGAEGGAEGGSRREFVPFGALWARGGQDGAARMRVSRPTVLGMLCSRLTASLGGL